MGDTKTGKGFWGPPRWNVLHSTAASYDGTAEYAEGFVDLLRCYTKTLPCRECRAHFAQNLVTTPVERYMMDNHTLFFWTYLLHDLVNQQHNIHKPHEPKKISPNYEEVKASYFIPLGLECESCNRAKK